MRDDLASPMGRTRKIVLATLSILLPSLLLLAVAEVATRLLFRFNSPRTVRENSLQLEPAVFARSVLKASQQIDLDAAWGATRSDVPGRRYAINAMGTRGRLFELRKPEGMLRIVVLGGSAVFDIEAGEGEDWPHLVERELRSRGHAQAEVINAGVPGHASFDSLGRLFTRIWMLEPDVVILYNAWNDLKLFGRLSAQAPLLRQVQPHDPRADPFRYPQGWLDALLVHSQVYVKLRNRYLIWRHQPGLEPRQVRLDPESADALPSLRQYRLTLELFVDACRNIGALPVLTTQASLLLDLGSEEARARVHFEFLGLDPPQAEEAMLAAHRVVREVAASKGSDLLDIGPRLSRVELLADGVHTNAAGSRALGLAVADFLEERVPALR